MARVATRRALIYRPRVVAAGTPYLLFDGNDQVNCGSGATLDDLHAGAFTVEMWLFASTSAGWQKIAVKTHYSSGDYGWILQGAAGGYTWSLVGCTSADARTTSLGSLPGTSVWEHLAMTYDAAGDRKIRHWVNGAEPSYSPQNASAGDPRSDAADNLLIGSGHIGGIGWVRISNVVRYTGTFTPAARDAPPATDANTRLLLKMDEGTGNPQDSSGNANHGTVTGAVWAVG